MKDKVSLAACSGMSNFGLICRAVASDLSQSKENISSICITSTAADDKTPKIMEKYPIITLNGCFNDCVGKILKKKGIKIAKTIDIMDYANKHCLEPGEVARLGENGEKTVKKLKKHVLKEIRAIR
ncbi:MAG: putative zinc-binding protein [Methanobacteriaceae archaeon]|jgi:uncharacterized metal-binding protein|nr:putative zinc-binding protein [Candidatus Methanorudis spinitermitis]